MSSALLKTLIINIIGFYQKYLSFDRGLLMFLAPSGSCKYSITCSEYTKLMILEEGVLKGIFKGLRRIISCR
ncbi:membrane protein insertion efficiency factor YidD [Candidatus Daviesbacteria bacterium]|nr:membrane protein insertion efficiency factor YidD [Candidatus Daviesbacteria bacterium]